MTWYFFLVQHAHLASLFVCWPPNSILLPSSIFLGWLSCLFSFCPVIGQSASLRKQLQQHIVAQCKGIFHKVVIRGVPFKSLLCAQGLFCLPYVSYTTRFPPLHDILPHFRYKALELADLGLKPLKLLVSVNLFVTLFFSGICSSKRTQPSTRRKN